MPRAGNTKVITISLTNEQIAMLQELCETSGMYASEIIQEAVEKIYSDPVEMEILMQNYIKTKGEKCGKKRLLRIMSIRSTRKKLAAQRASQRDRRYSISRLEDSIQAQWFKEFSVECMKQNIVPTLERFNVWKIENAQRLGLEAAAELEERPYL